MDIKAIERIVYSYIDIDINIDSLFYLDNALSYGNGASHRLDKQSV